MEYYEQPTASRKSGYERETKKRILVTLLRWVRQDGHLFDGGLANKILKFSTKLEKDGFAQFAPSFKNAIEKRQEKFLVVVPYPRPLNIEVGFPPLLSLLSCDTQIAEQLTLTDIELFQKIDEREFLNQKWNKEKLFARNLCTLINRTNQITDWVSTAILTQEKLSNRITVLKEMISIANGLFQLGNFHSLLGVLLAFDNTPVSRLKHTITGLSKKYSEILQNLAKIKDPSNQFKNLREAMKNSKTVPIPYLGLHLQNFAAVDEASPDFVGEDKDMINIFKYKTLYECVAPVLGAYEAPDIPKQEPLYTLLQTLPVLSGDDLYSLSLLREPRGCTRQDLL